MMYCYKEGKARKDDLQCKFLLWHPNEAEEKINGTCPFNESGAFLKRSNHGHGWDIHQPEFCGEMAPNGIVLINVGVEA